MPHFSGFTQENNVTTAIECRTFLLKAQFDRHTIPVHADWEEGVKRCVHGTTLDVLFASGAASNPEGFVLCVMRIMLCVCMCVILLLWLFRTFSQCEFSSN